MRIVLTGGGTGGHLTPLEPIIEALRRQYLIQKDSLPKSLDPERLEISFFGTADRPTKEFFASYDVKTTAIPSGKLRRYASAATLSDLLLRLPIGVVKAIVVMWRTMPDIVISKGGYGSLPIVVAATFYRIPILLHESDVAIGLANTFTTRFAGAIALGFAETKPALGKRQAKAVLTGTPVRSRFGKIAPEVAKRSFGFAPADNVVLVIGGSQGATQLNEALLKILPRLVLECGVIHITGPEHYTKITAVAGELLAASSRKNYYKPYPYLPDTVVEAQTAADVVVSRAGATTLAELARLRKPILLVPLPGAANDHQRLNAQVFERAGAARVLDPNNLGENLFERSILELLNNDTVRATLTHNIARFDHPTAATTIAEIAFKLAAGLVPTSNPA